MLNEREYENLKIQRNAYISRSVFDALINAEEVGYLEKFEVCQPFSNQFQVTAIVLSGRGRELVEEYERAKREAAESGGLSADEYRVLTLKEGDAFDRRDRGLIRLLGHVRGFHTGDWRTFGVDPNCKLSRRPTLTPLGEMMVRNYEKAHNPMKGAALNSIADAVSKEHITTVDPRKVDAEIDPGSWNKNDHVFSDVWGPSMAGRIEQFGPGTKAVVKLDEPSLDGTTHMTMNLEQMHLVQCARCKEMPLGIRFLQECGSRGELVCPKCVPLSVYEKLEKRAGKKFKTPEDQESAIEALFDAHADLVKDIEEEKSTRASRLARAIFNLTLWGEAVKIAETKIIAATTPEACAQMAKRIGEDVREATEARLHYKTADVLNIMWWKTKLDIRAECEAEAAALIEEMGQ